jgi:hypothetical protein
MEMNLRLAAKSVLALLEKTRHRLEEKMSDREKMTRVILSKAPQAE